jgi:hypothetical protein
MEPQRTGSTQKATKANIFPVVETVIEGRATMIAIRSAVITSNAYNKVSGGGKFNAMSSQKFPRSELECCAIPRIKRLKTWLFLFSDSPNIANKLFDLIVSQLALVCRHFLAFTVGRDVNQLRVGLLLYFL